ncbi:hypothetical protein ANTRET_LOCUS3779 [Anthophora retusa]
MCFVSFYVNSLSEKGSFESIQRRTPGRYATFEIDLEDGIDSLYFRFFSHPFDSLLRIESFSGAFQPFWRFLRTGLQARLTGSTMREVFQRLFQLSLMYTLVHKSSDSCIFRGK